MSGPSYKLHYILKLDPAVSKEAFGEDAVAFLSPGISMRAFFSHATEPRMHIIPVSQIEQYAIELERMGFASAFKKVTEAAQTAMKRHPENVFPNTNIPYVEPKASNDSDGDAKYVTSVMNSLQGPAFWKNLCG